MLICVAMLIARMYNLCEHPMGNSPFILDFVGKTGAIYKKVALPIKMKMGR